MALLSRLKTKAFLIGRAVTKLNSMINLTEGLIRECPKVTKSVFSSDSSLEKMLSLTNLSVPKSVGRVHGKEQSVCFVFDIKNRHFWIEPYRLAML